MNKKAKFHGSDMRDSKGNKNKLKIITSVQ